MAYTPVPSLATGYLWTAADHNTYIRDNFAAGVPAILQAKGDLPVASGLRAADRLAVGSNGQLLIADSSQPLGVRWGADPAVDLIQAKGDLLSGSAVDTLVRTAVGANGLYLKTDSAQPGGLAWGADPTAALIDAKGDLLTGSMADTLVRTAAGTNGYGLIADSTAPGGVSWAAFAASANPVAGALQSTSMTGLAASTYHIINFNTVDVDTDSGITVGASWKYTVAAGKQGWYLICVHAGISPSTNWVSGTRSELWLYKGGVQLQQIGVFYGQSSASTGPVFQGYALVFLGAGNYVDARIWHNLGTTIVLASNYCRIGITRVLPG